MGGCARSSQIHCGQLRGARGRPASAGAAPLQCPGIQCVCGCRDCVSPKGMWQPLVVHWVTHWHPMGTLFSGLSWALSVAAEPAGHPSAALHAWLVHNPLTDPSCQEQRLPLLNADMSRPCAMPASDPRGSLPCRASLLHGLPADISQLNVLRPFSNTHMHLGPGYHLVLFSFAPLEQCLSCPCCAAL